jgi:hypothetical protein
MHGTLKYNISFLPQSIHKLPDFKYANQNASANIAIKNTSYFALVQRKTTFLLKERKACNFTGMNNVALRGFN